MLSKKRYDEFDSTETAVEWVGRIFRAFNIGIARTVLDSTVPVLNLRCVSHLSGLCTLPGDGSDEPTQVSRRR